MRRSALDLETVADWRNLTAAFQAASQGKMERSEIRAFAQNLDAELRALRAEILSGVIHAGNMKSFWIRDPKLRLIHAPCFRDRVLHHALMALAGPVLECALIFDTYACRDRQGDARGRSTLPTSCAAVSNFREDRHQRVFPERRSLRA